MTNFDSDDHALVTGMILAMLLKADVPASPVMDAEGNFTPRIHIRLDLGHVDLTDVTIEVKA